ncbi:Bacteroides conjugative transposon TraN protein [Chitinophaga eiseniae]|uniref:Bacteroides conjugative transposon TraN protein n=1 Tax=Chitinophaga eiseniae TaxID=634771 RepID=A0A1T4MNZ9_9BACT|nr:conjugative transposon protein TraN [Chitinophaga eiseniae]SJZ68448.1 Bacteroides conjugative transposon TraN protein [Chitinophaga eiseniae]
MLKCAVWVAGLSCLVGTIPALGQEYKEIVPLNMEVSYNKTSNLIFPYAISSVDRGSRDLLVQKAKGVKNILQLKAGKENFPETNLSIVTDDGKFYSFMVRYDSMPRVLNLRLGQGPAELYGGPVLLKSDSLSAAELQRTAELTRISKQHRLKLSDAAYNVRLRLSTIFIKNDVFYFQVSIKNSSSINYYFDEVKFFIRDRKVARRTAFQEKIIQPKYVLGPDQVIPARTETVLVFALPKFTIPDKKHLYLYVTEKDGGRHLKIRIKNRHLVSAVPI